MRNLDQTYNEVRILFVEDCITDLNLAIREIQKEISVFNFRHVDNRASLIEELYSFLPDLVISDYSLPQLIGLDVIKIVTEFDNTLPVIINTGSVNEETAVLCMRTGATDYVLKENIRRLPFSVKEALEKRNAIIDFQVTRKDLIESERRYGSLISNLPGMVYRCKNDKDWTMLYVSEGCFALTGFHPDDFIDNARISFNNLIDSNYRQYLWNKWQKVLANNDVFQDTYQIRTADDKLKWVWEQGKGIYSTNGELLFIEGFITDISDKKQSEENLLKSEEKYRLLIENQSELIVEIDANGKFLFASPSFCKLFGYQSNDLIGNTLSMSSNSEQHDFINEALKRLQFSPQSYSFEQNSKTILGNRWIAWSANAICDNNKEINSVVIAGRDITERKKSDIELKKEQGLSQSLLDNIPDFIYFKDIESRFIRINKSLAKKFGLKNTFDAVGKSDSDFFTSEHAQKALNDETELLENKVSIIEYDEKEVKLDGTQSWVLTTKVPMRDLTGKITGIIGISKDITLRKLDEERMQLLITALEAAANAIVITDINGNIEWINKAFSELTGYSKEEGLGRNPRDLIKSGKHNESFYKNLWDTVLKGEVWKGKMINRKKDHSLYIEEMTITPVKNSEGENLHFIAIKQDVTERERDLEEKIQNENRLASLVRLLQTPYQSHDSFFGLALKEAIAITSSKIGFLFIYDEAENKLQLNSFCAVNEENDAIIRKLSDEELLHGQICAKVLEHQTPVMINDNIQSKSFDHNFSAKCQLFNKLLAVPIFSEGKEMAIIGVANKPSNYTQADILQLTLLMDSVLKVTERNVAMVEMIKAKERAEESDRLKSAFLANMSHEIRTPMNGILGFSELLKDSEFSKDQHLQFVDIIHSNSEQLLHIINDIIDISKIEAGQESYKPTPMNIDEVMVGLHQFFEPEAQRKNIYLKVERQGDKDVCEIVSDVVKLKQALTNLVSNAIKFTDEGGVTIQYSISVNRFTCSVIDTGIGVNKEMVDIIFERFRQADSTDTRKYGGTGLGLAISKSYIEMMNGSIHVESKPNEGSTFSIELPLELDLKH